MKKKVFLAFSAILISSLSEANDVVTVTCPNTFPERLEHNKSLPLRDMETWDDGIIRVMPHKGADYISSKNFTDIRCVYDEQHQITITAPKGTRLCTRDAVTNRPPKLHCLGPKSALPATPPPMFVAQPVDYSATLQGFGLRQTIEQIQEEAQRQGLIVTLHQDDGKRNWLEIAAVRPLMILMSSQTQRSIEVRQDFSTPEDRITGTDVTGPRLFGNATDFLPNDGLLWDRKTGVIVISQNWRDESPDNYLRLIDDAEISKETGLPIGYKKYAAR